jgi:hypothetical protein
LYPNNSIHADELINNKLKGKFNGFIFIQCNIVVNILYWTDLIRKPKSVNKVRLHVRCVVGALLSS